MNKLAALFPGQGSQALGMGKSFYDTYDVAKEVINEADAVFENLSTLMWQGPEAELTLTQNQQPALVTASMAAYRSYLHLGGQAPDFVAGHSLGEFSALVAANSLSVSEAVALVHKRGSYMQEAVPAGVGAMAAIMKLSAEAIETVCASVSQETGRVVSVANYNSSGQTVISGHKEAVEHAVELLKAEKARAIMLNVSAPFHCALMQPAADALAQDLAGFTFRSLACPLIANVTADVVDDATQVSALLQQQVTAPVRWSETMAKLHALGVRRFLEFGSGNVLTGLLKRTFKGHEDVEFIAVNDIESLQSALA